MPVSTMHTSTPAPLVVTLSKPESCLNSSCRSESSGSYVIRTPWERKFTAYNTKSRETENNAKETSPEMIFPRWKRLNPVRAAVGAAGMTNSATKSSTIRFHHSILQQFQRKYRQSTWLLLRYCMRMQKRVNFLAYSLEVQTTG